jgi:hypothetical protein
MQIQMAHLNIQGVNCAVFDADANSRSSSDRADLLADLSRRARGLGLRVDKSALAFQEFGRNSYYGTKDLVDYLANIGVSTWTHTLTIP